MAENDTPVISLQTGRVVEERRNVYIKSTYIYCYSRQKDKGYYVISGSTKYISAARFFNIEISGLPPESTYTSNTYIKLKASRDAFEALIAGETNGSETYQTQSVSNKKRIEFKRSLFFHKRYYNLGNPSGMQFAKSETFWEVYPVTYIKPLQ